MTERLHWCRQFLALGGIVVVKDVTAACGVSPELYHMLYENSVAHLAPLYGQFVHPLSLSNDILESFVPLHFLQFRRAFSFP